MRSDVVGLRTYILATDSLDVRAGGRRRVDGMLGRLAREGERDDVLVALPGSSFFLSRGLSDLKLSIAIDARHSAELARRLDDVVREAFTVTSVADRYRVTPSDAMHSTAYGLVRVHAPATASPTDLRPFLVTVLRALADAHPRGCAYGYVSQHSSCEALMELVTVMGRERIREQVRAQRASFTADLWDREYGRNEIQSRLTFIFGQMLGDPTAWDLPDGIYIPEMVSEFHAGLQDRSFLNIGTTPWFHAYRKLSDLVYNYVFWLCGVSLVERIAVLETTLAAAHVDGWTLDSVIDAH
jgi:hypothetical protein